MIIPSCNEDVSLLWRGPECIIRRSQIPAVGCTPVSKRERAGRMTTNQVTNIWNVNPAALKTTPSSYKVEEAVDVSMTDKNDDLVMKSRHVSSAHAEV